MQNDCFDLKKLLLGETSDKNHNLILQCKLKIGQNTRFQDSTELTNTTALKSRCAQDLTVQESEVRLS